MSGPEERSNLESAQNILSEKFPSPEKDLINLSYIVARTPWTQRYAQIRMLVYEIDDLISQTRWHIGQALLLLEQYPQIATTEGNPDPIATMRMPASAQLLLRGFIVGPERVLFDDLSERWRGGTVAGWIFHMMIDSSVIWSVSVLDRLARILCLIAEIPFDKVYFRSGKLTKVHEKLQMPETERLVEQSGSELYEIILDYRDGWSHDKKAFAMLAGRAPTDMYFDESGKRVRVGTEQWTSEYLLALANAAYQMVINALPDIVTVCKNIVEKEQPET